MQLFWLLGCSACRMVCERMPEARINIANLFASRSEEPADGVDFLVINVFNVGVHRI